MTPNALRECTLALAAGLLIIAVSPSAAASFALNDRERDEALRMGKRSIINQELGSEWTVQGSGGQSLTVMTVFHRLALAARNAAFKDEEPKPKDVESILKDHGGKLVFWVTLRGTLPEFARFYTPLLLDGRSEIKATFVQNERTALPEGEGRFAARCVYVFPADRLDPKGRVTLVVRDAESHEVAKFAVDLATMR